MKFSTDKKKKAVNLALKIDNYQQAAEILNIPKKNLKRWLHKESQMMCDGQEKENKSLDNQLVSWI